MVVTTSAAISWATGNSCARSPVPRARRHAEGSNCRSGPPQDHDRAARDDLNVNDRPEQSLWLGAEAGGQRWNVGEDDVEVLRGRTLAHLVHGGRLRLTGHHVGRAKSCFRLGVGTAPMRPLMAPPDTKDGAEGAHFQHDALTHGESCFLCLCSCIPRCPVDAGPSAVPLMWDRAEQSGAADPFAVLMPHLTEHPEAPDRAYDAPASATISSIRSGEQPPLPGAAWRTPTPRRDLPRAALQTPAGC
jgi:hypothetical protein